MMSQDFLKKIGILGVSFGLIASPLAFAGMQDDEFEQDTVPQEEPAPDVNSNQDFDSGEFDNDDFETEYEDEEEEWETTNEGEDQGW